MKKILKAAKLVKSCGSFKELGEQGFLISVNGDYWINRKSKIIVKIPNLYCFKDGKKFPKCAVYTKVIWNYSLSRRPIFLQPLVNIKRKEKACKTLINEGYGKYDLHIYNVGHYRNKAVMFDW